MGNTRLCEHHFIPQLDNFLLLVMKIKTYSLWVRNENKLANHWALKRTWPCHVNLCLCIRNTCLHDVWLDGDTIATGESCGTIQRVAHAAIFSSWFGRLLGYQEQSIRNAVLGNTTTPDSKVLLSPSPPC